MWRGGIGGGASAEDIGGGAGVEVDIGWVGRCGGGRGWGGRCGVDMVGRAGVEGGH